MTVPWARARRRPAAEREAPVPSTHPGRGLAELRPFPGLPQGENGGHGEVPGAGPRGGRQLRGGDQMQEQGEWADRRRQEVPGKRGRRGGEEDRREGNQAAEGEQGAAGAVRAAEGSGPACSSKVGPNPWLFGGFVFKFVASRSAGRRSCHGTASAASRCTEVVNTERDLFILKLLQLLP